MLTAKKAKNRIDVYGDRFRARAHLLSPRMQAVARYINENREVVLEFTAIEIAAATQTSDATVVRAIQALGFAGLRDLKQTIEHWFGPGVTSEEKMTTTVNTLSCDVNSSIDFVLQGHQRTCEALSTPQNRYAIAQAVALLVEARQVGIFGIGASGVLADYTVRLLSRIGLPAVAFNRTGINLAEQLIALQRGDVLIMMAQKSPHREGLTTIREARRLGVPVILLTNALDSRFSKEADVVINVPRGGENGKMPLHGTLVLAIFQSIGIATGLPNMPGMQGLVINPGFAFYFTAVVSLVTGTMFLMWLGEQITERGIGNGISIIIFAGIVAGLPPAIAHTIEQARQGDLHFLLLLLVAVLVFAVTFFVVFVERGQRRIVVNYAKRQQGRRVYAAQSTHLPLKVNMAGVIPAIFASSIILFPATITSWFGGGTGWNWLTTISLYLQPGQPLYVLLYASAIIFFCFFYTALVFNPRETADNLKKSGAFVPGIRPGEQTAKYIDKVMTRLTLVGALYITFICLIPEFMRDAMKVPFYFGGTSLLIVVVVIMDFMAQVQTLMMSSQYESALKKANLKGYGR